MDLEPSNHEKINNPDSMRDCNKQFTLTGDDDNSNSQIPDNIKSSTDQNNKSKLDNSDNKSELNPDSNYLTDVIKRSGDTVSSTGSAVSTVTPITVNAQSTLPTITTSSGSVLKPLSQQKSANQKSNDLNRIDIELVNDEGENDSVEIDIADSEKVVKEDKSLFNARRQSISDRINRRRTSELAAEIIRLSAEHRKKEFFELLTEHDEIVKGIETWKSTGVLPTSRSNKQSNLETVEDAEDDDIFENDDLLDNAPFTYHRQNNNTYYLSNPHDDKENSTLPRSH